MKRQPLPEGSLVIEAAAPVDLPAIEALLRACALPLEGVSDNINGFLTARWTRSDGPGAATDGLIGCIGIEPYGEACVMRSFAIDPTYRGRGIMRPLIDAGLQRARDLGCREAYLLTLTIESLARRQGFHRVERADVPDDILQCGEFRLTCCNSAIILRKNLDMRRSWQV